MLKINLRVSQNPNVPVLRRSRGRAAGPSPLGPDFQLLLCVWLPHVHSGGRAGLRAPWRVGDPGLGTQAPLCWPGHTGHGQREGSCWRRSGQSRTGGRSGDVPLGAGGRRRVARTCARPSAACPGHLLGGAVCGALAPYPSPWLPEVLLVPSSHRELLSTSTGPHWCVRHIPAPGTERRDRQKSPGDRSALPRPPSRGRWGGKPPTFLWRQKDFSVLGVITLSLAAKRRVFRARVSALRFPRTQSSLLHIFSGCFCCGRVMDGFQRKTEEMQ